MHIDPDQFRALFFEESAEHLEHMESALLTLEDRGGDPELLNAIFRAAHSIKGACGSFGFTDVASFTHVLESVLDDLRKGAIALSRELIDLLLRAADVLRGLIACVQHGAAAPEARAAVEAELGRRRLAAAEPTRDVRVRFVPDPELFLRGGDPLLAIRDLGALGSGLAVSTALAGLPHLDDLDPERCYLRFDVALRTARSDQELRDVFAFVEEGSEITVTEAAAAAPVAAVAVTPTAAVAPASPGEPAAAHRERSSIRVPTDKVDTIINLVGELIIAQAMITDAVQRVSGAGMPALREALNTMERNTRDLQERVMSVRMMPLASVFQRFPRLLRDLGGALGKQVELRLIGEEIELDKGLIEGVADPLVHLLRNAVDHGFETPDERIAAGKPEHGTLTIEAAHRGGIVHIQVRDDGRGIDPQRIRRKAVALGLVEASAELSSEQIHALLFKPGFSTADKVSDVSGRGVGMDVVKRNIAALNGSVSLESELGRGTTCTIKLPLTLAILEGLSLRVADQCFIVPLVNVVESFLPRRADEKTLFGTAELIVVRDETLPLVRLHRYFGLPAPENRARCLVTVVEHGARRVALLVDELLGQSQVVLKSLETNYQRVDGIGGATILGNGRVALVLDLQAIIRSVTARDTLEAA